ncbi:MAG TPA: EamA family transporter [Chthoniobacteraceae bacterium]|nr:EamA family transporter [Chthoniobacteraceae bacterium]
MTLGALLLVIFTQVCAVTGQIFVKKSMTHPEGSSTRKGLTLLFTGVGSMTVGFFLWLGLMPRFDLSYLFPFTALQYIFIVLASAIFLKERISVSLCVGVVLISVGVWYVSASQS